MLRSTAIALLSLFILLGLSIDAMSQSASGIISNSRDTDWSQAGVNGGIPSRTTVCTTLSPGATASQISTAIQNCPANQVVYLTSGTYSLSSGIDFAGKSSVTLRGAGPDKTILQFSGDTACRGMGADVCMGASDLSYYIGGPSHIANWTGGYAKGTTQITLDNTTGLAPGMVMILDQLDDGADTGNVFVCQVDGVCADEGPSGTGRTSRAQEQFVTVTAISGSTVSISPAVQMPNWRSSQQPQALWGDSNGMVNSIGVEDLAVDNTNNTSGGDSDIFMLFCYNCWVKNVKSLNANRNHVWFYESTHSTVRDSYFYGTQNAASCSYGIESFMGSDNLVENNIFQHIVGGMIANGAASGTVYGYNYEFDDYYAVSPSWMQASNYFHSAGADMILHEGNDGLGLIADVVHGTHNFVTAFRNRFTGWQSGADSQTVPVNLYAFSRYFNVIGNVLGTPGYHNNYESVPPTFTASNTSIYRLGDPGNLSSSLADPLVQSTLMLWGNYDTVTGTVRWNSSEVPSGLSQYANPVPSAQSLPASFYLAGQPGWWPSTVPWPPIGPDVTGGDSSLGGHYYAVPAHVCYNNTPKDSNGILTGFNANNCYGSSTTAPTVSSVTPSSGPTAGGTAVTITGTNFTTGAQVIFGTSAATNVVTVSATSITATTPPGTAGTVNVTVKNSSGQSGALTGGFTYLAPAPTVTGVTPNSGPATGGTGVTISGTNFTTGAQVTFGTSAAANVVVVSATSITATTPSGTAGTVNVTVTNSSGQSGTMSGGFTYTSLTGSTLGPAVTAVTPASGPTTGGTAVTITGANFAAGASVTFGASAATNVVVASATSIVATTPPGTAGSVNVTVTNSGGQSGTLGGGFTYTPSGTSAPPISFVQVAAATPQSPTSSVVVNYPAVQTAGNLNIVVVGWNDATSSVQSVSDTAGNTYYLAVGPSRGTNLSQSVYFARNIVGGANTVLVGFNQAAAYPDIRILEYSGLDTANPLDVTAAASGNSSTSGSGSATTTAANELVFAANTVATSSVSAGSPFVQRIITSPDGDIAQDAIVAAAGSYTASTQLSSSGPWVMQLAAFKGAPPLGSPQVTSIAPDSGPTTGGTSVTITGSNFATGAAVTLGSAAATNVVVVSPTSITAKTPAGAAGTVNVTVTNSNGQSGTLTGGFTYLSATPTLTGVSPNSGPTTGGTAVTITGSNFATGATVTFGSTAAINVVVVNATSITATTPPGTAGTVNVTVTNSNGQSGTLPSGFTYLAPAPTITSVSPASGPTTGGTAVTITGTNFATGAAVTLGSAPATNVVVVSTTSITATTPAGTAGTVNVTVTNSNGQSGTLPSGFTYLAPAPTITSVSPASGPAAGGTSVTITGTNFTTGAKVTLGSAAAANVVVASATSITATTPPGTAGSVSVTVTNPNGQSATLAAGFTYLGPITFVQVNAATPQSPTSTVTVTYPGAQKPGDMNIVVVGWNDTSATVQSVKDSVGNTYTPAIGPTSGTGLRQSIYYAPAIVGGTNTVTVTFNQPARYPDIRILEYSGVSALDVRSGAYGSGSSAFSGAVTTAVGRELIFGANMVYTNTVGTGSGFTGRIVTKPDGDLAEDMIVATTGTYSASAKISPAGNWVMQVATFK